MSKTGGILMDSKPTLVEDDLDPSFEQDVISYVEKKEEANSFNHQHHIDIVAIDQKTLKF